MEFSKRKLPKEAADSLRICPIDTVKPYALMLAPVYLFMKANEKFVSIKAPLDFFTPEEIDRLRSFECFYLPVSVDAALEFRQAARSVRALLTWKPVSKDIPLNPSPYEISDAVIRILGPLWWKDEQGWPVIEPFFVSVFTSELCDELPGELMKEARDLSVELFEKATLVAGWSVFLALHLGQCDLSYLSRLRRRVFEQTVQGQSGEKGEIGELIALVRSEVESKHAQAVSSSIFSNRNERGCQKLLGRFIRIKDQLMRSLEEPPSIYGQRGFIDA